jgi:hypothetical protein
MHTSQQVLSPVARGLVARELQGLHLAVIFNAVVGRKCPRAIVALLGLLHLVRVVLGRDSGNRRNQAAFLRSMYLRKSLSATLDKCVMTLA